MKRCVPLSSYSGSLHVVYRDDEAAVAREFCEVAPGLVGKAGAEMALQVEWQAEDY